MAGKHTRTKQKNKKYPCLICKSEVVDPDGIECESCFLWVHPSCAKIDQETYDEVSKIDNLVFYCNHCIISKSSGSCFNKIDDRFESLIKIQEDNAKTLKTLMSTMSTLSTEALNCKSDIISLKKDVAILKEKLITAPQDRRDAPQNTKSYSSKAGLGDVDLEISSDSCKINCKHGHISHISTDRSRNILMYNIPESTDSLLATVNDIFTFLDLPHHLIIECARVGKENPKWPRPVKIATMNPLSAQAIIKNAYKLAKLEKFTDKIYIKADYSFDQRQYERKLVKKCKELKALGKTCKIKGLELFLEGKILELPNLEEDGIDAEPTVDMDKNSSSPK